MFWDRFYELCIKRGTKPNQVGKSIGISSGTITKWKSTNALPNGESLTKIADYLDCSVDYLLGRTDVPDLPSEKEEDIFLLSRFRVLSKEDKEDILCLLEAKYNRTQGKKETKASGE